MSSKKIESEVAKELDLSVIRYSRVWEDPDNLRDGLGINGEDDILSITSSGDNALNILLCEPKSVVAIDMSPAQNACMELKLAVIREGTHGELVTLIAERDGTPTERKALFDKYKSKMPAYAQEYWTANLETLEHGLIHTGRLDKFFATFARDHMRKHVSEETLAKMLDAPDLATQKALFEDFALKEDFQKSWNWYFGEDMIAKSGRSAAQMKYIVGGPGEDGVAAQLFSRLRRMMGTVPIRSNYFMQTFFAPRDRTVGDARRAGEGEQPTAAPAYLLEQNFERLRALLPRLSVVTGTLEAFLSEHEPGSYNKANLSDVFEYMSEEAAEGMFKVFAEKFRLGGRLAYWCLFTPRLPAGSAAPLYKLQTELADKLHLQDRCFFYRSFHVAEVVAHPK